MRFGKVGIPALAALALGLATPGAVLSFHGSGQPPAPGDTTAPPPGSSESPPPGGSGGGNPGPGDIRPPGPGGPGAPSGPATGSGARPGTAAPGPSTPGSPAPGPAPSTAVPAFEDVTAWDRWWACNWRGYIDLRRAAEAGEAQTDGGASVLEASAARRDLALRQRLATTMLALLASEKSSHVVTSSLLSLARIGDVSGTPYATTAEALLPFLADSNATIAEVAALSLGIHGRDDSVHALSALLADEARGRELCQAARVPERIRAFAAYGLGFVAERTQREDVARYAAGALAGALREPAALSHDLGAACVLSLGLVRLPYLHGAAPVADAAPAQSRESLASFALGLLAEDDLPWIARAHAPISVAKLLRDAPQGSTLRRLAIERLHEVLAGSRNEKREVQQSAVIALGLLADADEDPLDKEVRRTLLSASSRLADVQARAFALIALAHIGARPGEGKGDAQAGTREAREHLARELTGGQSTLRPWAALALGILERGLAEGGLSTSRETLALLRTTLAEERSPERMGALCIALGIARDPGARTVVEQALGRTMDETARGHAMIALGVMGAVESGGTIEQILRQVRRGRELFYRASVAHALLQNASSVPRLVALLEESPDLPSRWSLCFALGRAGNARGVDPLLATLRDARNPDILRGAASEAIGWIVDKDERPFNLALSLDCNYAAAASTLTDSKVPGVLDL